MVTLRSHRIHAELSHCIQAIQDYFQTSVSLFSHPCCVSLECFIFLSFHPPQTSLYFCFRGISNAAFSMKAPVVHSPSPQCGSLHPHPHPGKAKSYLSFSPHLSELSLHVHTMVHLTPCELLEGRESVSHSVP